MDSTQDNTDRASSQQPGQSTAILTSEQFMLILAMSFGYNMPPHIGLIYLAKRLNLAWDTDEVARLAQGFEEKLRAQKQAEAEERAFLDELLADVDVSALDEVA